jgi:hypothetical protein
MTSVNPNVGTPGAPGFIAYAQDVETFIDEALGNGAHVANKIQETFNVKNYGALGDNATNDTAAIQAAISAAVAAGGGTVLFPKGIYVCASGLSWSSDDVYLVGVGARDSRLKFTGTGTGITVGDGTAVINGLGIRDLALIGSQTQPATGLWLRICWQVNLTNVMFLDFATDHLKSEGGGHQRIIGCQVTNNVAFTGTYFRLSNVVVSSIVGCTAESNGGTFIFLASACNGINITSCHHYGDKIDVFLDIGGTGQEDVSITGCTARACVVAIDASSGVTNLAIGGCVFRGDSTSAVPTITLANCDQVSFVGNVLAGGGSPALSLISCLDVMVVGCYIKAARVPGRSIFDDTNTTGIVAYNTLSGDTAPNMVGTGLRWYGNKGLQPQGVASITVGASPFTYTAGVTPEAVYISGGTVSSVAKNSRTIFTASPATVYLEPREAIVVTYSALPVMERDRK